MYLPGCAESRSFNIPGENYLGMAHHLRHAFGVMNWWKHTYARRSNIIGGWGWKRSGAETPTGNPSPAPIAIAPHASHARHDRSIARWISVARAKVGGHHSSPTASRKVAPSRACPFVHFEQGITLVSWWTCLSGTAKIRFW